MSKANRKHYLILPSYQLKLVGFMSLIVFIGSILHGFFLYRITSKNIQEGFLSAHNRLRSTWEILKPAIVVTNGLSFLLMTIFILIITIFISHKVIGPIFKIAGHIKKLSSGSLNLPALRLRQGDEGSVLCESVNKLQDKYRQRFIKLKKLKENIDSSQISKEDISQGIADILNEIEIDAEKV